MTYTLADITKARNDSHFPSKHDVCGTLDTIDERFTASIVIVKLGFCDRIIDVDGRDLELPLAESLVEMVDTSGSLLRETSDICEAYQIY